MMFHTTKKLQNITGLKDLVIHLLMTEKSQNKVRTRAGLIPQNWESCIMIPKEPTPMREPVHESIPKKESILIEESIPNRESNPNGESILSRESIPIVVSITR